MSLLLKLLHTESFAHLVPVLHCPFRCGDNHLLPPRIDDFFTCFFAADPLFLPAFVVFVLFFVLLEAPFFTPLPLLLVAFLLFLLFFALFFFPLFFDADFLPEADFLLDFFPLSFAPVLLFFEAVDFVPPIQPNFFIWQH